MATAGPGLRDRLSSTALARLLAVALPAALLGGALLSQYVGGLHPCEMCIWQRWPHGAAILLAALAFLFAADSRNARLLVALAAIGIAISGGIGGFHAGVELKYWEGLTRCSTSGAMSLDELMKVPLVRCDQIQFSFLGISMAGWNAILSLGGAGTIAFLLGRRS